MLRRTVDQENAGGLQGLQERTIGGISTVRKSGGGQAERCEQRGAQLWQSRFHGDERAVYRNTGRQQAQRLVDRDGLSLAGVPVHAHDPARGDRMRECFGHSAQLTRGHHVRARHVQARPTPQRRWLRRRVGLVRRFGLLGTGQQSGGAGFVGRARQRELGQRAVVHGRIDPAVPGPSDLQDTSGTLLLAHHAVQRRQRR
ncbi:hypothetical protein OHA79_46465 (plasmid) [Streptomyces sp. NBC_00841]|uniref:hypothetical protein n=1 Tax=unclassified Streptomyces TaxID=2593676 RepID=UPI0022521AA7|nr:MULTISPECIES: hypothetical protein [unclassified Streptomyces]MCX4537877.1 hypothetical protein [Streptomyces sp. NBC_01669]WSA05069.1 hypothetical protein OHA79_46465 [Streptomyces sp. NBC_00841]